jgi:hypothetical protein
MSTWCWCKQCWALIFLSEGVCPNGHGEIPERDMVETLMSTLPIGEELEDEHESD